MNVFNGTAGRRLASRAISMLLLFAPTAWGCGPFDMKITRSAVARLKSFSSAASAPEPAGLDLQFARAIARQADLVFSDASLMGGKGTWHIHPTDSHLSKQHAMLEFVGYFRDYIGVKEKLALDKFLSPGTMAKFYGRTMRELEQAGIDVNGQLKKGKIDSAIGRELGIAVEDLMSYPSGDYARDSLVRRVVKSVFTNGDKWLQVMAQKNQESKDQESRIGYRYFSRPAWLTADEVVQRYGGAGPLLACTGVSYGRDAFRKDAFGQPKYYPQLSSMASQAIRASIIDKVAALALKAEAAGRDPIAQGPIPIVGGVTASLEPVSSYRLVGSRMKCFDINEPVEQTHAVVRQGPEDWDQRFVQVGRRLYAVKLTLGTGMAPVDISGTHAAANLEMGAFMGALATTGSLDNAQVSGLAGNVGKLIHPAATDHDWYHQTADACDELTQNSVRALTEIGVKSFSGPAHDPAMQGSSTRPGTSPSNGSSGKPIILHSPPSVDLNGLGNVK